MMASNAESNWIVRFNPDAQARLRLFCFPFSGGIPAEYRSWANRLPRDIEVCAVHLPGRANRWREPAFTRMQPLVEAVAQGMLPLLNRPFAFWGHSLGTLVAFETARWLRRNRWPGPARLFVAGNDAPDTPREPTRVHAKSDAELVEWLRKHGGAEEEVLQHTELLAMTLPAVRADFEVFETYAYTPEPPLACPITAFGGERDPLTTRAGLEAWAAHTAGRTDVHWLAGDHFFPRTSEAEVLAAIEAVTIPLLVH